MKAGRRPKLTESARESSSFPIGEYAPKALAAKPSKKSKTAAASISMKETSSLPENAQTIPATPLSRFSEVIVFGIFFMIIFMSVARYTELLYTEFLFDILRKGILVHEEIHGLVSYEIV